MRCHGKGRFSLFAMLSARHSFDPFSKGVAALRQNKRKIWTVFLVSAFLAALVGFLCWQTDPPVRLVLEAEITGISLPEKGYPSLTVLDGTGTKGIILQKETRIFSSEGKNIPITDLHEGQTIRATVGPDVMYEPYDTYLRCYKIEML